MTAISTFLAAFVCSIWLILIGTVIGLLASLITIIGPAVIFLYRKTFFNELEKYLRISLNDFDDLPKNPISLFWNRFQKLVMFLTSRKKTIFHSVLLLRSRRSSDRLSFELFSTINWFDRSRIVLSKRFATSFDLFRFARLRSGLTCSSAPTLTNAYLDVRQRKTKLVEQFHK